MARRSLRPLLAPRSIAIIGASEAEDSWAPEIYRNLSSFGFRGSVFPVNPKYDRVWGFPCVPSADRLPEGVDLAVVVVPARVAVRAVDEAGRAGVRSAMVVSSGFAEGGPEGMELQRELSEVAVRHRMRVLGPNVEGFVNYQDRVAPYGAALPPDPRPGGLTVVSGSGTVVWSLIHMASDRGVGMRAAVGLGNEAGVRLGDLLSWAAADPATRVVACYAEAFRDIPSLERGLVALRGAGKPVLFCAPEGKGEAARRSVVAHTGILAGNTAVRDAWLRRCGAVLVRDPVELFEASVLLLERRRVRASGVAAAMQSGGACTLFAEAAERDGLELPELRPRTARDIEKHLPTFANPTNPLDVTGQAVFVPEMYKGALTALAAEEGLGIVVVDAAPPRGETDLAWAEPILAHARGLERETGVTFLSVLMTPLAYPKEARAFVEEAGIPFLHGHRPAVSAIRALLEYQDLTEASPAPPEHTGRRRALRLLRDRAGTLEEVEAGRLLEAYGLERPAEALVETPGEAASSFTRVGPRVAVKALAPELPHKASADAVRLSLTDPEEVREAGAEVLAAARRAGARWPRILVQRMVEGVEILIGAVVDEQFGPAVALRPGGDQAERGPARFVGAPLAPGEALTVVAREAERCGLDPARHDLAAVAGALEAVGRLAHDLRHRIVEVEANPFVVTDGGGVAVDALAVARRPRGPGGDPGKVPRKTKERARGG